MQRDRTEKQHVRTLTSGWRFTLPAPLRRDLGWDSGTPLSVTAGLDRLVLLVPSDNDSGLLCHLGSGGKIVVPAGVRKETGWRIGERLSVKGLPNGVEISACCQKNRCRSCGSLVNVVEVIDNLYLCSGCWKQYLASN